MHKKLLFGPWKCTKNHLQQCTIWEIFRGEYPRTLCRKGFAGEGDQSMTILCSQFCIYCNYHWVSMHCCYRIIIQLSKTHLNATPNVHASSTHSRFDFSFVWTSASQMPNRPQWWSAIEAICRLWRASVTGYNCFKEALIHRPIQQALLCEK
jgi:hypothetical protein